MSSALEATQDRTSPDQTGLNAGVLSPSCVASSAAPVTPKIRPAWDGAATGVSAAGRDGVAALTSSQLQSIVRHAREAHGPHRMRWETPERKAWHELTVVRGEAA